MRRTAAVALFLVVLSAAAPGASAVLTKSLPFETTAPFMLDLGNANSITLTSGAVQVEAPAIRGSLGLFGVAAFTLRGLTEACWIESGGPPTCSPGDFNLEVTRGSSVGLCFPAPVAASFEAKHALTLFLHLAADDDLNSLPVNRSLVAPAIDSEFRFTNIGPISDAVFNTSPCATSGAIAALDANSTLTLRSGATVVTQFVGKSGLVTFAGSPTFTTISADLVVLPFDSTAQADFTPASKSASDRGLNGSRLESLIRLLDQSHSAATDRNNTFADVLDDLPQTVKELLNGALVQIPAQAEGEKLDPRELTFARFTHISATTEGGGIHFEGRAVLAVQNGHIDHDHKLVGIKFFALPWLGIVLWLVAIAVWIVRLSLHPEKQSRWDKLRWIGWIATPLSVLLVFFLVDLEVRHLVGSSFLSGAEGKARAIYFLIDFGFMGILGAVAGGPLRLLLRNSFLLGRQGTFMGLAGSIATLISYFLAVTFFRDYLDLVFSQVVSKIA